MSRMFPAVFVDRDGVLIEDVHLLTQTEQVSVMKDVPAALTRLRRAGLKLVLVTNQPVVARGLALEKDIERIHGHLNDLLEQLGARKFDAIYFCPHHPNATVPSYRLDCPCRKPKPGMILAAAKDHSLDLARSFMVGDRVTDIVAGASAGCKTVLLTSGRHVVPPIETVEPLPTSIHPDHVCSSLFEATEWILEAR